MKDSISAGNCGCSAPAKQVCVKPTLEGKVVKFFSKFPGLSIEWLHYKM